MTNIWAVLLVLAAILQAIAVGKESSPCKLKPGLYRERGLLVRKYARLVGKNYQEKKAIADSIVSAKKSVDRQYYNFLDTLASTYASRDHGSLRSCCTQAKDDPLACELCALVQYLDNGRREPERFIASFPQNEEQRTAFWSVDDIVHVGGDDKQLALADISLPNGLVDKYIEELFALVLADNSSAVKQYFKLLSQADGEYAEYMDELLKTLFEEHPKIVLRQWLIIRENKRQLERFRESLAPQESAKIVTSFQSICKENDQPCGEIIKLFR